MGTWKTCPTCITNKDSKSSLPALQEDSCLRIPAEEVAKALREREQSIEMHSTAQHDLGTSTFLMVEHSPGVSILPTIWWKRRVEVSSSTQGGHDGFCLFFL